MKKSLLALAVAAMAASSVASAATVYEKDGDSLGIYGRVQGVMYNGNTAALNHYDDISLQASGRLGFDMRTQLTQGVAGFAKMEWDVADGTRGADGGEWGVRYAWIGADFGQYGQIKGGRFEDATKYVLGPTDIYDDWGCYGQNGDGDKRNGIVMYSWNGYGVDVLASFQGAADDHEFRHYGLTDIDMAGALAVGYKSAPVLFGPIAVKAGFGITKTQVDETTFADANKLKSVNDYAFSASWGDLAQGLYVAALYNHRTYEFDKNGMEDWDIDGVEFAVAYGFANGVSLRTGYMYKNVDKGAVEAEAHVVPVYVNYQINPRFNVWTEARFDVGTDDGTGADASYKAVAGEGLLKPAFSVGARYTF
ncbi:porin [Anaerobiospirillum thomasii]|uniref:Porin OmpC n=1 Tax=Anaerobiospirillum thomasii TaxID=179995 RepID=A0A2X0V6X3_9GAMM|nr:porin [Anaerobiospirillum thomasii]SPT70194.1 Porin OmpC [Anaerobiospirillum thomasii]